jgi:hypothetical protein
MPKFRTFLSMALAVGLLSFAGTWTSPAAAEDCPRGFLDEQYCDRDGNLTADLPLDPADWVDPDTLVFAYTPVEDPPSTPMSGPTSSITWRGDRQEGAVLPGAVQRRPAGGACAPAACTWPASTPAASPWR